MATNRSAQLQITKILKQKGWNNPVEYTPDGPSRQSFEHPAKPNHFIVNYGDGSWTHGVNDYARSTAYNVDTGASLASLQEHLATV